MRLVVLMASLLLILNPIVSYSYDFLGEDPIDSATTVEQTPPPVVTKDDIIDIRNAYIMDCIMQNLHNAKIECWVKAAKEKMIEPPLPEVVAPPVLDEEVPVTQSFELPKPEKILPNPDQTNSEEKLGHLQVIIHCSTTCTYCPPYKKQAETLKDKYDIVIEDHGYQERSKHGTWLTAFPVTEVVKDGKLLGYKTGYMSADKLDEFIQKLDK